MQKQDRTRQVILDLWRRTKADWGFLSSRIYEVFRRERLTNERDRASITSTVRELVRHYRKISFALECASRKPLLGRSLDGAELLAMRVLAHTVDPSQAAVEYKQVDWTAVRTIDLRIAQEADPARRLGLMYSLPDFLATRLQNTYGTEAKALAKALNEPPPTALRANMLLATRDEVMEELEYFLVDAHTSKWAAQGILLASDLRVPTLLAYREGRIEVQDEASQLVAEFVAPAPGTLVVDACAGAGGKSLALGALMKNKGMLVAMDRHVTRLDEFKRRARRAGLSNHRVLEANLTAATWPKPLAALRGKAARVLVDVPCTGTGALRRNPEARWRLKEEDSARLAEEQLQLARAAAALCKPNGRLIYATCSILSDENEGVVKRFLDAEPTFELIRVAEILGRVRAERVSDSSGHFLKLLPHRHGTDGFFAAALRRKT